MVGRELLTILSTERTKLMWFPQSSGLGNAHPNDRINSVENRFRKNGTISARARARIRTHTHILNHKFFCGTRMLQIK